MFQDKDDIIHDWELWGDPREIERRKAERKKANIPPEVRRTQVAAEWVQAKQMAAAAKSAGDKARQKEAGTLIRDLKLEMKGLGEPCTSPGGAASCTYLYRLDHKGFDRDTLVAEQGCH